MINKIKQAFALIGILFFIAFIGITIWLAVTGTLQEHFNIELIALCGFLGFGLLSLGIRWLQDLKKKELAKQKAAQEAEPEQKA